ncbi:Uncharacterised protein [Raoultella terrigena]|uniref:Uncharacterized protein n=1 Tax=Raoultella terrigena TaxID=577 RepID=A0A4V6J2G0_RAOTE|nr:Uncharacterised protein [Raoultella terrigena]
MHHQCIRGRYATGVMPAWEFEREGESYSIQVNGPLVVSVGSAVDLAVDSAIAGTGVINLFEEWLQPAFASGQLEPILQPVVAVVLRALSLLPRSSADPGAPAGVY